MLTTADEEALALLRQSFETRPIKKGWGSISPAQREQGVEWTQRLLAEGWPAAKIAESLGVSEQTVYRWRRRGSPQTTRALMKAVRVVDVRSETPTSGLTLISPRGWRVEGLTEAELLNLLERLP